MITIAVFGATGRTGKPFTRLAVEKRYAVRALVRNRSKLDAPSDGCQERPAHQQQPRQDRGSGTERDPRHGRIPVEIPANKYDAIYLQTKRSKSGHLFDEIPETVIGERIDCMHRTSTHQPRFAAAS